MGENGRPQGRGGGDFGHPRRGAANVWRHRKTGPQPCSPRSTRCTPGQVHAIEIGNHPDWPSLLLACLRRQVVVLPLDESTHRRISARRRWKFVQRPGVPADWGEHPPVLLKLTSGTTAAPRAIRFRSEQLLADCRQICDTMGITDRDLNFAVIPALAFLWLQQSAHAAAGLRRADGSEPGSHAARGPGRSGADGRDGLPRDAGFLSGVLRNGGRAGACRSCGFAFRRARRCRWRWRENSARNSSSRSIPFTVRPNAAASVTIVTRSCSSRFRRPADARCGSRTARSGRPASRVRVRSAAVGDGYFPEPDEEKLGDGRFVPDDLLSASGGRIPNRRTDFRCHQCRGEKGEPGGSGSGTAAL